MLLGISACYESVEVPEADDDGLRAVGDGCTEMDLDGDGTLGFGDFLLISEAFGTEIDGTLIDFPFFLEFSERFGETCEGGGGPLASLPGCAGGTVVTKSFIDDFMSGSIANGGPDFRPGTRHRTIGTPSVPFLDWGLCSSTWWTNPEDYSAESCEAVQGVDPSFCPGGGTELENNVDWTIAHEILFLILKKFDIKEDPKHPDTGCWDTPGALDGRGECHRLKTNKEIELKCDPTSGELLEWNAPPVEIDGGPEVLQFNLYNEVQNFWGSDVLEMMIFILERSGLPVSLPPITLTTGVETVYDFAWQEGESVRFAYAMRGAPNWMVDYLIDTIAHAAANGPIISPLVNECAEFLSWDRNGAVNIWHATSGLASCECNGDECDVVFEDMELHGSGFPTHRMWTSPWEPFVDNWLDPEDGKEKWGPEIPPDEEIEQGGIGILWQTDSGDNIVGCDFASTCESPDGVADRNGDGSIGLDELEQHWCEAQGGTWNGGTCAGISAPEETYIQCDDGLDNYGINIDWGRVADADYDRRAVFGWVYAKEHPAERKWMGSQDLRTQCRQPDSWTWLGFELPWDMDPEEILVLELMTSNGGGEGDTAAARGLVFDGWFGDDAPESCTLDAGGQITRCEVTKAWLDENEGLGVVVLSTDSNYGPNWEQPPAPNPPLVCTGARRDGGS